MQRADLYMRCTGKAVRDAVWMERIGKRGRRMRHIGIQLLFAKPAENAHARLQGQRSKVDWQWADMGKLIVLTGV